MILGSSFALLTLFVVNEYRREHIEHLGTLCADLLALCGFDYQFKLYS